MPMAKANAAKTAAESAYTTPMPFIGNLPKKVRISNKTHRRVRAQIRGPRADRFGVGGANVESGEGGEQRTRQQRT
jgi:hypothetical protein